jgi:hypothetical protein
VAGTDTDNKLYSFALEDTPPIAFVVLPEDGAVLSDTAVLDAAATDNVRVSRVEFHLAGAGNDDALIGSATATRFGWILNWDTTGVANGPYLLTSVAYDPAGNIGRSSQVSIQIQN